LEEGWGEEGGRERGREGVEHDVDVVPNNETNVI
jgi:hypothetical protein